MHLFLPPHKESQVSQGESRHTLFEVHLPYSIITSQKRHIYQNRYHLRVINKPGKTRQVKRVSFYHAAPDNSYCCDPDLSQCMELTQKKALSCSPKIIHLLK